MAWGTISVRMLWPFMRLLRDFGPETTVLQEAGVDAATLADPDARLSRLVAGRVVIASIKKTGDAALGLHAGERLESEDFGVMGQAARTCPDFRSSLQCATRYHRLQTDGVDASLIEEGDRAIWELRQTHPTSLRASNDFQVSAALTSFARYLGHREPPLEVHLRHSVATNAEEYARVFQAPVHFDKPHNAIVFRRALLDTPVASANPDLLSTFELRAERLLGELARGDSTTDKVTRLLAQRIGREDIGLEDSARQLRMSAATLRRHLASEGSTYKELVDRLRRELALHHIKDTRIAIGEIAFLLGFSTQSAFGTAFRRWTGTSPREHRMQARGGKSGR